MAHNSSFDVFISGGSTSVDEYLRAMAAPKSQLPELTPPQKLVARKLGLSEEEYRRGVLADRFGESRILERGKRLGQVVQTVLDGFDSEYRVEAIKAEMASFRWLVRITGADCDSVVAIPRDLADDVLDSGASEQVARLKNCLVKGLDRQEPVAKD